MQMFLNITAAVVLDAEGSAKEEKNFERGRM